MAERGSVGDGVAELRPRGDRDVERLALQADRDRGVAEDEGRVVLEQGLLDSRGAEERPVAAPEVEGPHALGLGAELEVAT
ncbi:MAG: hypothetical protein U0414_40160 [Polyangiaceae bacterium]